MIDKTLDKINKLVPQKWQWILSHEGFRKYFKNTGWLFLGQFSLIISFLINIWIARYLGPDKFGLFSYAIAFVGIFAFIANLGVADVVVRELVKKPEKRDLILGTAFRLLFFSGLVAFFISCLSIFIFEDNNFIRLMVLICSTVFFFTPFSIISNYFQAEVLAKKNAIAQIVTTIIVSIFKIWVIITGQGLLFFAVAFVLDYAIGAIIYFINYKNHSLSIFSWRYDKKVAKSFFSSAILLTLSAAAGYLLMKIDQVMIKNYLDNSSLGFYAAAVKISETWYFIPGLICSSLFPAIINAKITSKSLYKNRLNNLYILLGLMGLFIAIVISFFAKFFISFLYGSDYLASVPILQIYVWSGIGMFLMAGINKYLLAEDNLRTIFFYNLFAVVINIILNLILIPRIGLLGAAWATLISYSIWPISIILFNSKKRSL